ncbi:MAG: hypothetical protein VX528_12965 [Candidatus Latescibacterota bacterium]|jgi:hypothetical protein|nr:hypothetical protein [Candidatus Latescibacterota bacterium]MEC8989781.1 hypothetical protein [Candidatus Latescibacterota bacterium]MEC9379874.1 hypothetical protein [Candidatus Latescibacterota bacterium]MED5416515.1 hypothetical protein [Candidatus Latescibacterota bacterium]MEE3041596.1 hypothetical protein [Candidatus Latescibacterota bacterium]
MTGLQTFWTWIFGLSVFLFFLVEVVVVFGGARDIGDMLRSLLEHAEQEKGKADSDR